MLALKPTAPPPLRAATALTHLPSCILGHPCKGLSGRGHLGNSPRVGALARPLPHPPGTLAPRPGVQSQRAGARLRAGELAPAAGHRRVRLPSGARPGARRGDEEGAGRGRGFLLGRARQPGSPLEHCSSLAEGRKWLCLLCNTDVCARPGLVGKGGEGGGDNTQVTG